MSRFFVFLFAKFCLSRTTSLFLTRGGLSSPLTDEACALLTAPIRHCEARNAEAIPSHWRMRMLRALWALAMTNPWLFSLLTNILIPQFGILLNELAHQIDALFVLEHGHFHAA